MHVGVPREIKNHEYRVGLTPAGVRELCRRGHRITVETRAGAVIGFPDEHYVAAGANIAASAKDIFAGVDMIIKVKEPQPVEYRQLRPGQILYTYLHLAPDPEQTKGLIESGAICIAYETVTDEFGGLPLLAPMSEVAGRMSIQAAARALESSQGGSGVLLGGVPGVAPAHVTVIGGGVVGINAARMALGLGADVTILDRSLPRLRQIDNDFEGRLRTLFSTRDAIEAELKLADAVVGAVLIPGAAAPKLVTRDMLKLMKPGSVLVDVAIDQGGCAETSRATTHHEPTYVVDGVTHYCVANMPGGVARTSTVALTNATLAHAIAIADKGVRRALEDDLHLRAGLNVCLGKVTCEPVARDLGLEYVAAEAALAELPSI
ncbi:MAG: alanine dehydrogenase [Gammaproteobacteria bacterium]|nr:alanine dehydrogenase [Gammaproteobacteria bacterium]MBU1414165.1 alanine dehydrogenase [Gammaproteobacteria bacterium]